MICVFKLRPNHDLVIYLSSSANVYQEALSDLDIIDLWYLYLWEYHDYKIKVIEAPG